MTNAAKATYLDLPLCGAGSGSGAGSKGTCTYHKHTHKEEGQDMWLWLHQSSLPQRGNAYTDCAVCSHSSLPYIIITQCTCQIKPVQG